MRVIRQCIILTVFTLLILVLSCSLFKVYGIHTPIGKAYSVSYVSSKSSKKIIILVGDSRTMQCTYKGKNSTVQNFIFCFVNGGSVGVVDYRDGKLSSRLRKYINKYKKHNPVVVFNLGVNGNGRPKKNAKRAIKIYNRWTQKYPNIKFYVTSIGRTYNKRGSYSNSNVLKFNKYLRNFYKNRGCWIDIYRYMEVKQLTNGHGKGMRDKVHYSWSTTKSILKMIRRFVD